MTESCLPNVCDRARLLVWSSVSGSRSSWASGDGLGLKLSKSYTTLPGGSSCRMPNLNLTGRGRPEALEELYGLPRGSSCRLLPEIWQDRVGLKLSKSYTAFPADLRVDCCPTSTHHHSNHQSYSNKTETEYLESNYSHSLAPGGVRTEDVAPNWNKDLVSSGLYVQNQDGMVIADARSSTTHHLSLHNSVLFTQNSNIIILGWTPVLMSKVRMIRLSPTPEVRLRTTLSLPRSDCVLRVQDKTKLGGLKSKRQVFGRFTPAKWNIVDPKIQPEEMAITSLTQHFHVTTDLQC